MIHRRKSLLVIAIGLLVLVLPLSASSQEPADGVLDDAEENGVFSKQDAAKMTPAQRIAMADSAISEMRGVLSRGVELLEKTRAEEQDIIKLNCINEKLSAIKGFLKVAEQSQLALNNTRDEQEQIHQSKLIMLSSARVQALAEEMEACAGDIVQYSGPTKLDLKVDDNIRTDNPSEVSTTDLPIDPLPDASPYQ